jgi:hypothetical protein
VANGQVQDYYPFDLHTRGGAAAYVKDSGGNWVPWDGTSKNKVWDTGTLSWVSMLQPGGGIPVSNSITCKSALINLSSTGTIIAAVASKRIKVYAIKLVADAALSVSFRDGASTALEGAQALAANGGYVENVNPPAFLFGSAAGNSLDLVITGSGNVRGRVSYWDDDTT